jgi:hypothetical protein
MSSEMSRPWLWIEELQHKRFYVSLPRPVGESLSSFPLLTYVSPFIFSFFAMYHGLRRSLQIYYPQPIEENIFLAATATLLPLGLLKSTRPIFPYGVLLIFLDAFNEMTEQYK